MVLIYKLCELQLLVDSTDPGSNKLNDHQLTYTRSPVNYPAFWSNYDNRL